MASIDIIDRYVQNQLVRGEEVLKNKLIGIDGAQYYARNFYVKIKKLIQDYQKGAREPRIIGLSGLRGVGKTTVLAHVYFDLLKTEKYKLFISADQLVELMNSNLFDALEAYQRILGFPFESSKEKIYLLIDEIHFDQKWAVLLKSIFDRSPNVFVICTGSSALALNLTTDLARRIVLEKVYPLCFTEYVLLKSSYGKREPIFPIKSLKSTIKQAITGSDNARELHAQLQSLEVLVNQYWQKVDVLEIDNFIKFGTMPNTLNLAEDSLKLGLTLELVERVIEKDFISQATFSTDTLAKIKQLLFLLADSEKFSVNAAAESLGNISIDTLRVILEMLVKSEVLIKVMPYGNIEKKVRKPSKYYFTSPLIRHALIETLQGPEVYLKNKSVLLEDVIVMTLYREFNKIAQLYFDPSDSTNADFILAGINKKIAIEVGYGNKGKDQVEKTLAKFADITYGIVISQDKLHLWEEENIVRIPLKYILLM